MIWYLLILVSEIVSLWATLTGDSIPEHTQNIFAGCIWITIAITIGLTIKQWRSK